MTTTSKAAQTDKNGKFTAPSEEDLAREIEGLRNDLAALTNRFSKIGDAGARTASEYSRGTKAAAVETGEALYADFSSRASELEKQAAQSIRRHPLQALGLAAGIGFLAALLTRR